MCLLFSSSATVAKDWAYLYEQDGVKVFRDPDSLLSFRAEATLEADTLDLVAILADIPRRTEWVRQLVESRVLEGNPEEHVWIYSRYDLPWPAADRDTVIESKIQKDYEKAEISVSFKAVSHPSAPPLDDVVRVPMTEGLLFIKSLGKDRVFVRYDIKTDPGGALPEWISSYFVRRAPINTISALKAQLRATRGQYHDFIERQRSFWPQSK